MGRGVQAAIAVALASGCGGGRARDDGQRVDPARVARAVPEAAPFVWRSTGEEVGCAGGRCGARYKLVVEFDGEAELTAAGWRRAAGHRGAAAFGGGVWTAPAGEHDEWLRGPTEWGRIADRTHGWAITATVEVRPQKASCAPSTRGPGLRLSGDAGTITITTLPGGLELHGVPAGAATGSRYTVRVEGHERSVVVSVDGKQALSGALSDQGHSSPPAIEFGQLGCSHYESRWDRLVVEANLRACEGCGPDEHPMIAAVRRLAAAGGAAAAETAETAETADTDTTGTAAASSACLAHAALDHAIRTVLVAALVDAGQPDRAAELARLEPLADRHAIELAERVIGPMGVPPVQPGCDPVRSADECRHQPPETVPAPAVVEVARRQFPNNGFTDHTASGREAMFFAALAIHQEAGAPAIADLLRVMTALARGGGACAAGPRVMERAGG